MIGRGDFLKAGLVTAAGVGSIGQSSAGQQPKAVSKEPRPNIVFLFADDWGWRDLSCHGHPWLKTPNLDRLAREGIDFQQFNVLNPVRSPSRVAALTGHYPARYSVHQHFAAPASNHQRNMPDWLDPEAPTWPRLLKQAGYRTAHFGKWHLTNCQTCGAPRPEEYGYDAFAVFNGGAEWPSANLHATASNAASENTKTGATGGAAEVGSLAKAVRVSVPLVTEREDGLHVAFLESDLYSAAGFESMGIRFSAAARELVAASSARSIGEGQFTPWRVILIGETAGDLTVNTVALNLAALCKLVDTRCIKPGKGLRGWRIHGYNNGEFVYGIDTHSYLHLIDFCAKQGLEYFTVDDHWFTTAGDGKMAVAPEVDIAKVMAYAKERGVMVMLYYDRKKGDLGDLYRAHHASRCAGRVSEEGRPVRIPQAYACDVGRHPRREFEDRKLHHGRPAQRRGPVWRWPGRCDAQTHGSEPANLRQAEGAP